MDDNWTDVRSQMDQVLESERVLRQARRRQQPSVWPSLRQWWPSALRLVQRRRPSPASTVRTVTLPR